MFILVNGSPIKEFILERGLIQGDPNAPFFIFLIIAKGLAGMMREAMRKGRLFKGFKAGNEMWRCQTIVCG